AYPQLSSRRFDPDRFDPGQALDDADVVIVHEWNSAELISAIGRHRTRGGRYVLLFHDTHHRSATDAAAIGGYDLDRFDGVLACGEIIRQQDLALGWSRRAWTGHEAAQRAIV